MYQQKKESKSIGEITVLQRKNYHCLAKFFCCKCIHCCQDFDFSLLTSTHRKSAFQKMIHRYIKSLKQTKGTNVVMDPFFILVALLLGEDSQTYSELMGIITNQSHTTAIFSKEDLQFYIPELCTYLVFHEEINNMELQNLLVRACKVDLHFSLKYYFYMHSLETINIGNEETRKYERVEKYNNKFRNMINNYYKLSKPSRQLGTPLNSHLSYSSISQEKDKSIVLENRTVDDIEQKQNIRDSKFSLTKSAVFYKYSKEEDQKDIKNTSDKFKSNKIQYLKQNNIYQPFIFKSKESYPCGLFQSTINFFSDLVALSKLLLNSTRRKQQLIEYLKEVNNRLPATVYIPFTKDCYQNLNIINILYDQSKIFATKQRAPYYICMESFYNPSHNEGMSKDKKIRSLVHHKGHIKISNMFDEQNINQATQIRESQIQIGFKDQKQKNESDDLRKSNNSNDSKNSKDKKNKKSSWGNFFKLDKIKKHILNQKTQSDDIDDIETISNASKNTSKNEKRYENQSQQQSNQLVSEMPLKEEVFGQIEEEQFKKISQRSPYSNLPGYKLIHIIVKSFDDLRQQNFAMQLLQEFDKIFKIQKIEAKLLPYQVLPLSYESGIMECVKDAITIDELRKKGCNIKNVLTNKSKMKNFISTLAAYSLITFLLQVKDRHNGNIMIKKDGSIFHIDYGFFMSNAPGKGVQLQKNLPFKLTNEYIEALGGLKSKRFLQFRRLFYRAFNACRKHQHRILILTKLMYSSYGKTMPCFIKGDEAISKLQERFNPVDVYSDVDLSVYCQNLINSSVDNWRSRWYDKWQYYVQGILY